MTHVLLLSKNVLSNTCIFTVVLGIKKHTFTWLRNTARRRKFSYLCGDLHCQATCLQVFYYVCNEMISVGSDKNYFLLTKCATSFIGDVKISI